MTVTTHPTTVAERPGLTGEAPDARRRSRRRASRRNFGSALLFLSPWLIGFLIFTAWPLIYSAYLSFTDYDVINSPNMVGLDNYTQLFQDPKIALSLGNTFFFTALMVPLHVFVALMLALLLQRAARSAGFFRTLFFLPKMTPPVAVGILFLLLFNGQNGLINTVLGWFGINGPAWTTDPAWVKPGLVMMSLWTLGASVIILLAALKNVPEELYESARLDGAGFWRQAISVTLPMISPALFFIIVVNTIAGLQTFDEAYTAFFGAGNTDVQQRRGPLLLHLPVPAGLPVPPHGLRVGDGVAAVRAHHDRDSRSAARVTTSGVLRGGDAAMSRTIPSGATDRTPERSPERAAHPSGEIATVPPTRRSARAASAAVPKRPRGRRGILRRSLVTVALSALAVVFAYPFIWLVSASFKPRGEVFDNALIPHTFTLEMAAPFGKLRRGRPLRRAYSTASRRFRPAYSRGRCDTSVGGESQKAGHPRSLRRSGPAQAIECDAGHPVSDHECPLWVISGHTDKSAPCPLYPQ